MRPKIGLSTDGERKNSQDDKALITQLLDIMHEAKADFSLSFYALAYDVTQLNRHFTTKDSHTKLKQWLQAWQQRRQIEARSSAEQASLMQSVNPVYIPRNHQIEKVIRQAEDHGDFTGFHALHRVLQTPFHPQSKWEAYQLAPTEQEKIQQTFCGT